MRIQPRKLFNKRHWIVIGIIALLIGAVQTLPYIFIFDNKVPTEHSECVEIPAKPDCTSDKSIKAYKYNEDHTEITKLDAKTCYDYYTNQAYESRLPFALELIALLLIVADAIGIVVGVGWLIVKAVQGICYLLQDSYEEDDDEK